jgi:signal peptidase I
MRFYRLEKNNYFSDWAFAILKSVAISLLITIALMLCCGYKFMIISSGSMEPTLPVGSLVIVTPCKYEDLQLNDIVTMNAGGVNLTHRIVGKMDLNNKIVEPDSPEYESKSSMWYTKGDNSDTIDGRLTKEIIGKVQPNHCFTWTGWLVTYVKANYVMIIVLAIILFVFVEVMNYLKGKLVVDDIECYDTEDEE